MKKLILAMVILSSLSMKAQALIIAHRGYWKTNPVTPQNSIQSLKNADKIKAFGSEFDVHLSLDGVLVINHDEDHEGMIIEKSKFEDLKKVTLSNGETIPTLEDYLKEGSKLSNVRLVIELKPLQSPERETEMVNKGIDLVKKMNLSEKVDWISFSLHICKEMKRVEPNFKVQYLKGDLSPTQLKAENIDGLDYHFKILLANPTWIPEAKKMGLITNSWTVNDPKVYLELKKMGIDLVTTDIPEELQKLK